MKRFVAGVVIGLVLSAGATRAEWSLSDYGELKSIRVELQRIANALDRLVSIQSKAVKQPAEKP